MLDDLTTEVNDKTVHSVAHGVVRLEELAPEYGAERRRLRVVKYRGQRYRGGFHDFVIDTGGVRVFPRLVSSEHRTSFTRDTVKSASPELDTLLGGGLERGSSTLVIGPAGTGKSLITLTFAVAAVERGEKAAMFIFDEELGLLFERAKGLGLDLQSMVDSGNLIVEQVDAAELAPGEFAHRVRVGGRDRRGAHDHHRQPQRLSGLDAGGAAAHPPHARAAAVPEPAGDEHLPDRRPARAGRRHEVAGRRHLSRRHRDPAPLFRGGRPGSPRHLGDQEAHQRARGHDPRISDRRVRDHPRRAAGELPGRAARDSRADRPTLRRRSATALDGRALRTGAGPGADRPRRRGGARDARRGRHRRAPSAPTSAAWSPSSASAPASSSSPRRP